MGLVNGLLHDYQRVEVDPVSSPVEAVRQSLYYVDKSNKTKQALAVEIQQPPRGGHQDVQAPPDGVHLGLLAHAAEDDGRAQGQVPAVSGEAVLDLDGQLPGGGEEGSPSIMWTNPTRPSCWPISWRSGTSPPPWCSPARFTSWISPMSSIRSASSSTKISMRDRSSRPWPWRSSSRPGVATRMSRPRRITMNFRDLGLTAPILKALTQAGYTDPTPIQRKAIPPALAGRDVLGCAQTGTGKTCAFAAGGHGDAPGRLVVDAPRHVLQGQLEVDHRAQRPHVGCCSFTALPLRTGNCWYQEGAGWTTLF